MIEKDGQGEHAAKEKDTDEKPWKNQGRPL